jgi:UDP-N-acetylmuramate dehydrogenase
VNGNAGSFFKNPVLSRERADAAGHVPECSALPAGRWRIKLAAGWLIDQCQLKGKTIGGAAVHRQQALVLINEIRQPATM